MDAVQVFNDELQSLYDTKPPVSKAKMGLITRAAMKGVKFYKHIVQTVEKFIFRCRPEYKVPGLYVIDSIVRQSRHQFGIERDVYAARFSRNLQSTFHSLFSGCSAEDRPKIVRVLNLWQKNGVYDIRVIQPLLEMADPRNLLPIEPKSKVSLSPNVSVDKKANNSNTGQASKYIVSRYDDTQNSNRNQRTSDGGLKFSKNMLDFDYDEDDDDDGDETPTEAEPPLSSTLNKIVMEQRVQKSEMTNVSTNQGHQSSLMPDMHNPQPDQQHQQPPAPNQPDPVLERWNRLMGNQSISSVGSNELHTSTESRKRSRSRSPPARVTIATQQHQQAQYEKHAKNHKPQKETNNNEDNLNASASRDAEREAERQKKCFPKIRDKHLTICSSTLWLGHVPKTVSEADISDAFGEYGAITSIDLIPPRGCAYVCMDRRQDAKRALSKSRDLKLNGSHIKMAWAPGKGFKEYKKLKDFWESDIGCSFIPFSKVDDTIDFDTLEEGGVIDEDSMSMEMRQRRDQKAKEKEQPQTQTVQPNLSLPMPTLPILNQPPPVTSMTPFTIPPPTSLSIPPPTALGQGLIPFPPPNIPTSANNMLPLQANAENSTDYRDPNQERDKSENIDEQISMTERQIRMAEQQLSMIHQAKSLNQSSAPTMITQSIHHSHQPNPMMFDMPPPNHLAFGQQMLDSHMAIFANQSLLAHSP